MTVSLMLSHLLFPLYIYVDVNYLNGHDGVMKIHTHLRINWQKLASETPKKRCQKKYVSIKKINDL